MSDKIHSILAEKKNLGNLVNYQDGSVVSRTIIEKETGTITLFAFDQNQGLSEHTAPFDAMVYIVDGAAEIIISEQKHELRAGEAIIMPADEPHASQAKERFKMLLIMIRN